MYKIYTRQSGVHLFRSHRSIERVSHEKQQNKMQNLNICIVWREWVHRSTLFFSKCMKYCTIGYAKQYECQLVYHDHSIIFHVRGCRVCTEWWSCVFMFKVTWLIQVSLKIFGSIEFFFSFFSNFGHSNCHIIKYITSWNMN